VSQSQTQPQPQSQHASAQPRYSVYFLVIVGIFITCLIVANIIAVKIFAVNLPIFGLVRLPAGIVIFPISYIFGDILTEVYGYGVARRVIWLGFLCNLLAVVAILIGQGLPAAPGWNDQPSYDTILGYTPRLLSASFIAYLFGEFANSFVLAKLKIVTNGRWLWTRTISSTVVGQALDSAVFVTLAFVGTLPGDILLSIILAQWVVKSLYEVIATPLTYVIVDFLKRKEGIDVFDRDTNFNPLLVTQ